MVRRGDESDERDGVGQLTVGQGVAATRRVPAAIIGAGHSGLALSKCLQDRAVDHVVLERGKSGELVAGGSAGTPSGC